MPTLRQSLEAMPYRDLRGVATRLNVRQRDQHHKEAWIAAIWNTWHDPGCQAHILATLSPAARTAAGRLALSGSLPAALFLAEYGPVRRPRPGQHWSPPPWEAPATVSEELYYSGLLAPTENTPLEKAGRLTLPADLAPLFRLMAEAPQPLPLPMAPEANTAAVLLHDVAQSLCFLVGAHATGSLHLLHDRWLPPAALAELNRRLLRPQSVPPRSHVRSRWLRFLFFLATAAGLQDAGRLTPSGWTWLARPLPDRLACLWDAWRTAPVALRQAYRQPTAALPEPWPDLALKHLADLPSPFTVRQLSHALLGREQEYTAYFAAHLADLSDLDAAVGDLLAALADDWGVLAAASPTAEPAYRLTALGRWLITGAQADPPAPAWEPLMPGNAQLQIAEDGHWELSVPNWSQPIHQAHLALYASYDTFRTPSPPAVTPEGGQLPSQGGLPSAPTTGVHVYRLDADTVAAAAAIGYGLPTLLAALADLGLRLTADQVAVLQAWHGRGRLLQIVRLPLLRAADKETMAQVMAHPQVRAGLGDLLAPTVALIATPAAELAQRLRAAGFFPQEVEGREQGAGGRGQGDVASRNLPFASGGPQAIAALWLAGQLYALLGELMPLPLPPPFADLAALLDSLPPADRADVQAQWEALQNAWRNLLDGQTYAPPPQPTDPNRWRPIIETAIAAGRSLTIRYFTAGRNVLTERTVTPYWIEEHRGIPYLRADCHLAGRVRLFRLDRIVGVVDW